MNIIQKCDSINSTQPIIDRYFILLVFHDNVKEVIKKLELNRNLANCHFCTLRKCTPLIIAAEYNKTFIFKKLLEYGASIQESNYLLSNVSSHSLFSLLLIHKYQDIQLCNNLLSFEILDINRFINYNGKRVSLLYIAIDTFNIDIVITLLLRGVNPNHSNVLFHAAYICPRYRISILDKNNLVKNLIIHGADPNIKNNLNQTILHLICMSSDLDLVQFLCERMDRTAIDAIDVKGNTALHIACKYNRLEIALYLCECMSREAILVLNNKSLSSLEVWDDTIDDNDVNSTSIGNINDSDSNKEAFRVHVENLMADIL